MVCRTDDIPFDDACLSIERENLWRKILWFFLFTRLRVHRENILRSFRVVREIEFNFMFFLYSIANASMRKF